MKRLIVVLAVLAAGCAQLQMGHPVPSADTIRIARNLPLSPLALGEFKPAPGLDPALDRRVVARTNTVYSPFGSSFALYLKEALAADLQGSGLLDPSSTLVLDGWLTESDLQVPNGPARAAVSARFVLRRGDVVLYQREHRASDQWAAGYVGVEAVPDAMNRYAGLYRRMVADLLKDPDFQRAAARR